MGKIGNKSRLGQKKSLEERKKISITLKKLYSEGKLSNVGERNPRYIDGLSKIDYNAWHRRNGFQRGVTRQQSCKYGGSWGIKNYKGRYLSSIKNTQRRRALKPIKIEDIQKLYEENIKLFETLTCSYCLQPILFGNDQIDHIIPIMKNGDNSYKNLIISCDFCNNQKHNKTYEEYGEWITGKRMSKSELKRYCKENNKIWEN